MIYGQSGGGSKVACLMGMPSAAGLFHFHRASVQSGGGGNPPSGEQSRALTKQLLADLGAGAKGDRRAAEDGVGQTQRGAHGRRRQNQSYRAANSGMGSPAGSTPRVGMGQPSMAG
jgi:para-nitrobenzyl esterase